MPRFKQNLQSNSVKFRTSNSNSTEHLDEPEDAQQHRHKNKSSRIHSRESQSDEDDGVGEPMEGPRKAKFFARFCTREVVFLSVLLSFMLIAICSPFITALFLPLYTPFPEIGICSMDTKYMFECFPNVKNVFLTADLCRDWDCCWQENPIDKTPTCYHRFPSNYSPSQCDLLESPTERVYCPHSDLGPLGHLDTNYRHRRIRIWNEIMNTTAHIKIYMAKPRGETDRMATKRTTLAPGNETFQVIYEDSSNWMHNAIIVQRIGNFSNNTILRINSRGGLIVTTKYTEFTLLLPEYQKDEDLPSVYGLGFNVHSTFRRILDRNKVILFNNYTDFEPGNSMYGSHPMYLVLEEDGKAHGVLVHNGHVMEARLEPAPAITFRTLGGPLDLYVSVGRNPLDVMAQFTDIEAIGKPSMPPYWALGFHMCQTSGVLDAARVISKMRDRHIPHESDCLDADAWKWHVYDQSNKQMSDFISLKRNQSPPRILALVFPQVIKSESHQENNVSFQAGISGNLFVKNSSVDDPYYGTFFDESVVAYPDVTHSGLEQWMKTNLRLEQFDGFIINWNTPIDLTNKTEFPCVFNAANFPDYLPPIGMSSLSDNTLCMDARYNNNQTHAELHNSYGHRYMATLAKVLKGIKPDKRPFLLNLATSTGSGQFGGHWGGEYPSTWEALRMALVHMFEASLYGIPLTGTPICGHTGTTNEQLCLRWLQLGAFSPLSFMYYDSSEGDRHPVAFKRAFEEFSKRILGLRYSLLPYLYTLFYYAHKLGAPVLRPLAFEFPTFAEAREIETQFLWGSALMFVPCLEADTTTTSAWIPPVRWYDYYTGEQLVANEEQRVNLPSPDFYVNLFIRAGYAIATQRTLDATTIAEVRRMGFVLVVALDDLGEANGDLYLDDGESPLDNKTSAIVRFTMRDKELVIESDANDDVRQYLGSLGINTIVEEVKVFGVPDSVANVTVSYNGTFLIYDKTSFTYTTNDTTTLTSDDTVAPTTEDATTFTSKHTTAYTKHDVVTHPSKDTDSNPSSTVTKEIPSTHATDNTSNTRATYNIPSTVTNVIHSTSVTDNISSTIVTDGISSTSVTDDIPTTNATDNITTNVTDDISTTNVTDYIPSTNVTDNITSVNVTDIIPSTNVTDEISSANVTDNINTTDNIYNTTDGIASTNSIDDVSITSVTDGISSTNVTDNIPITNATEIISRSNLTMFVMYDYDKEAKVLVIRHKFDMIGGKTIIRWD